MVQLLLALYFANLQPIDRSHETDVSELEPVPMACLTAGCCDKCSTMSSGMQACIGCEGSTSGSCPSGETTVPCPPGTCWHGSGKVNIYVTGGNSACDPAFSR